MKDGWEPAKFAGAFLDGWVEVTPLELPAGSKVTITGHAATHIGGLFEGEECLVLRLRVEVPGEAPVDPVYHSGFRHRRDFDLSHLKGLVHYVEAAGRPPSGPIGLESLARSVLRLDGKQYYMAAGDGPPLPYLVALDAQEIADWYRKALADADRPDEDVVPYHPELLADAVELAYRTGRKVRARELALEHEAAAERAHNASKAGGEARGLQKTKAATAWQTQCRFWAQALVEKHSKGHPLTKGQLADLIIEFWATRPFTGGPAGRADPPSYDTLTDTLIPKWKKAGLRGLK